ncbi:MAG: NAD+ synthase [Candidatus Schekmanbacteria bacterium]|nr:MAG: NAD+ synthase [Candidatus Schekmanbacteria bacterium]
MKSVRIAVAQINTTVGDLSGNSEKIISYLEKAVKQKVDIVTFPELAITGYPPKDLLNKRKFIEDNISALKKIKDRTKNITAVIGFVNKENEKIYNSAAIVKDGKICGVQNKIHLPNYDVFDEKRYFSQGEKSIIFTSTELSFGVSICEDIWIRGYPTKTQAEAGANILINISASPYHMSKPAFREKMLKGRCRENSSFLIFNNLVGGQDDLVFDGNSMIINPKGEILNKAKLFEEDFIWYDIEVDEKKEKTEAEEKRKIRNLAEKRIRFIPIEFSLKKRRGVVKRKRGIQSPKSLPKAQSKYEEIYNAIVLGVKDYVHKNGFKKVVIGLSGGIDSSLVATIAVDALGCRNVLGISMPTSISSSHSIEDAQKLAENLSIKYKVIEIQKIFETYLTVLSPIFKGRKWDVTEENLQARIRGNILMAVSNKFGYLLLTTGNKSELSVGYATLYGDMAGGLAVISDVPKTMVYKLAKYRNSISHKELIPRRCLTKPPSAELRPNQKDTDSLPKYEVLDKILHLYVEEEKCLDEIIKAGIDEKIAREIILKIDGNEYKRQQAPPGIRITPKAFGSGRRIPITNKYRG